MASTLTCGTAHSRDPIDGVCDSPLWLFPFRVATSPCGGRLIECIEREPGRQDRIVTVFTLEVRASSERFDVHARQLVRDILQLPRQQLPSVSDILTDP